MFWRGCLQEAHNKTYGIFNRSRNILVGMPTKHPPQKRRGMYNTSTPTQQHTRKHHQTPNTYNQKAIVE